MGVKSDYRNLLGTCRGGQFAQIIVFFKKDHPYWTQNSFYQPQGWSTCTSGPGGGGVGGRGEVTFSFLEKFRTYLFICFGFDLTLGLGLVALWKCGLLGLVASGPRGSGPPGLGASRPSGLRAAHQNLISF